MLPRRVRRVVQEPPRTVPRLVRRDSIDRKPAVNDKKTHSAGTNELITVDAAFPDDAIDILQVAPCILYVPSGRIQAGTRVREVRIHSDHQQFAAVLR